MKHNLSLRAGEWLFNNVYFLYQPLYFVYKRKNEKFEIELIKQKVKAGDVVIDIGANIGFYTKIFSKLVGENGCVYAFEPDKKNFQKLKYNTQHLSNVVIENKAVAGETGKIKLYVSELNVDHRTYPSTDTTHYVEIDAVSLDDYFKNNEKINLIKMDIQGYEYHALQGMKKILQQPSLTLFSEFWPYGLKQSGTTAEAYINFLKQFFSKIHLIHQHSIQDINSVKIHELPFKHNIYFNILAEK